MNLTWGEAEALTRGVEAEAVLRCGGRKRVVRRAFALRHYVALRGISARYPKALDKTVYAIDLGFTGKRRVLVDDGKVVSHGHLAWEVFLSKFCVIQVR
ncbi:hypothetical protein [Pseudomonas sp. Irchel 3E13]|uniref:hypothetical protein n=1 Tax=Pseudomonas sp. Irchel 3E13 TaxID=2008975 RepID=UPI000BA3DE93|nr:hypothetical protein [Pseudomonas sp. Irchel 3E13]